MDVEPIWFLAMPTGPRIRSCSSELACISASHGTIIDAGNFWLGKAVWIEARFRSALGCEVIGVSGGMLQNLLGRIDHLVTVHDGVSLSECLLWYEQRFLCKYPTAHVMDSQGPFMCRHTSNILVSREYTLHGAHTPCSYNTWEWKRLWLSIREWAVKLYEARQRPRVWRIHPLQLQLHHIEGYSAPRVGMSIGH